MRQIIIVAVILLISGCADIARSAAARGDLAKLESHIQYVDEHERRELWTTYNNKVCGDALAMSGPDALTLLGLCNVQCKTPRFCDRAGGFKKIIEASKYGYEPARELLTRAKYPLPPVDSNLLYKWQAEEDRAQRDLESVQLISAINSLGAIKCVTTHDPGESTTECN